MRRLPSFRQLAIAVAAAFTTQLAITAEVTTRFNCDRACLARLADRYFQALAAHNPATLPLAPNVKYTETGIVKPPRPGPVEDGRRPAAFPAEPV